MTPLQHDSVFGFFAAAAAAWPGRPFLNVLPETAECYDIAPGEITYGALLQKVEARKQAFAAAGIGKGRRIGVLLENRPSFLVHWLAMNALGASLVPINPDLRASDLRYLIDHSEMALAVSMPNRRADLEQAGRGMPVVGEDDPVPDLGQVAAAAAATQSDEAALLYTSGTTGLPKGCVLSNRYFLNCGQWYSTIGGYCALREGGERMLTPLPLFHMNALACSVMAMVAVGGCLTVLDRFHPATWWDSVRTSRAGIIHYLGIMPPMLMKAPTTDRDLEHQVRFGFGAGVDRTLHAPFEARFGFPLIEAWAMTETGNGAVVAASEDPRHAGTGCFGKPADEVEVRIERDDGSEADVGAAGELLVRRRGADPHFGFFDRYLKDDAATVEAWRGGWFHTGDVVRANEDGTLVFVDRKKNVIRRSGENISAVEVEGVLLRHHGVRAAGVTAVPDDVRGEEVMACIVAAEGTEEKQLATDVVRWCLGELAYFKAPGYIAFVDQLPLTATNKLQRGQLKALAAGLVRDATTHDLRHLKKRVTA